jgi:predicted nucleic acid-binding Zn ribbon protein
VPLHDFKCLQCGLMQERFHHADPTDISCATCSGRLELLERSDEGNRFKSAVFPFVTKHIDSKGRPMTIESMGHLRQVEKDYGVVLSAFSNELNNSVDSIKDPPTYRGWDREHGHR